MNSIISRIASYVNNVCYGTCILYRPMYMFTLFIMLPVYIWRIKIVIFLTIGWCLSDLNEFCMSQLPQSDPRDVAPITL